MREERGRMSGNVVVYEPFTLWGSIAGTVRVIEGGKFYIRGAVYGDMIVEFGGRVHIFGNVSGDVRVLHGAKVIHSGVIGGNAINEGGRLFIERGSQVMGQIKTKKGDTVIDPKYQAK